MTGLTLEVDTTSPGLQFYTGNQLKSANPIVGKNGVAYPQYSGFVVETQVSQCRCSLHASASNVLPHSSFNAAALLLGVTCICITLHALLCM